ncbi:transformation system, membrane protein CtsX [Campylobacter peloridis]|uniref:Transformation system, membrane protein CtsX n=1 Tax=Campylobacter peloridis TaxID=488546 RepID=A0ABX6TW64_9BACT|nr:transformation system, membrane protein CtsX [Campylobacter peloridis]AJC84266.1 transformation system, membrane protein CtsX [Campylobacter peloridis LMG 23910]MBX2078973.1 transformation system, membrane protein CtsX [Campylobacter peloridis]QOQ88369.1 transformation system, membrane protein CtsX [Campylobacter peloridis]
MKIICFSFLFLLSFLYADSFAVIKNEKVDSKILYEKFIQNPNYHNALNLAQFFYINKDYDKAIFWAVEANEIDNLKEEAWLVFINAKIKQGKNSQALKAKEEYEKLLNVKIK